MLSGSTVIAQTSGIIPPDVPVRRMSAWHLSDPLGSHIPTEVDTLLYNYQRQFIPALNSDAWASTGQLGGEGINMIFFDRPQEVPFMFRNALLYWLPTFDKEKFYNVYIPWTQLSYNFGGAQTNKTDRLKAEFAGNVNRRIGLGASVDYLYTKGSYNYQAAKDIIFGFQGYYNGDRYEMQAFFNQYNFVNKENGGITNDLYITDPAQLQGGVTSIESRVIPTRLTTAHSRLIGSEFYMNHAWKVGFWRDDTQPGDTIERRTYVPVTKFIYSFDYKFNHHLFNNFNASEAREFWKNTYFDPEETTDETYNWSIANTLGISMIEGFQRWAQFGISAYATYTVDNYRQEYLPTPEDLTTEEAEVLTPVSDEQISPLRKRRHHLQVGGRLERMNGKVLKYSADVAFGLLGETAGDINIVGNIETKIPIARDSLKIDATGYFKNLEPDYLLKHYVSNHFIWNNDFGKTRKFRVEGSVTVPWSRTKLSAGVENVQNYIYFNSESLPAQYSGSVQIFSARLEQNLKFGIWNWNNRITYQATSNADVIPLPALAVYSNMFLNFKAFKVLELQIGVDCDYYTRYRGLCYQPATMSFHVQDGADAVDVGNFAIMDAYLTARLYKVRFFVLYSHFNQNLFSRNYFALPHYPVYPRQLRFGLSIDFAN